MWRLLVGLCLATKYTYTTYHLYPKRDTDLGIKFGSLIFSLDEKVDLREKSKTRHIKPYVEIRPLTRQIKPYGPPRRINHMFREMWNLRLIITHSSVCRRARVIAQGASCVCVARALRVRCACVVCALCVRCACVARVCILLEPHT